MDDIDNFMEENGTFVEPKNRRFIPCTTGLIKVADGRMEHRTNFLHDNNGII